jgi:hypothetical protein
MTSDGPPGQWARKAIPARPERGGFRLPNRRRWGASVLASRSGPRAVRLGAPVRLGVALPAPLCGPRPWPRSGRGPSTRTRAGFPCWLSPPGAAAAAHRRGAASAIAARAGRGPSPTRGRHAITETASGPELRGGHVQPPPGRRGVDAHRDIVALHLLRRQLTAEEKTPPRPRPSYDATRAATALQRSPELAGREGVAREDLPVPDRAQRLFTRGIARWH